MNVAFVHDVFPSGGAERMTVDIARYLNTHDNEFNIYVYCQDINKVLLTDSICDVVNVRHIRCKNNTEKAEQIEKYIISDNIDVIVQVVHRVKGIEAIKERTGVKVVMSNHGEAFWQRFRYIAKKKKRYPILWNLGLRFFYENCGYAMNKAIKTTKRNYDCSDAYTVLCEEYKNNICNRLNLRPDQSHIHVIGNPEHPVSNVCFDKEKIIMYCGRLYNSTKRVDRLLRIWKRVQNELNDWRLILVGDGPDRSVLEKQIVDDSLSRVEIVGWVADVNEYYKKSSILCITSQTESWGLALTEAQANGVIPIAFDCSAGVRAILSPSGENGFLITPFKEQEYARTLIRVAKMDIANQMYIRNNVVKASQRYSLEAVGEQWVRLLNSLKGH